MPPSYAAGLSPSSFAAALTQRLYGVPFSLFVCFLDSVLQALAGDGEVTGAPAACAASAAFAALAAFAIAVTQRLKSVPFWPASCFLDSAAQYLP